MTEPGVTILIDLRWPIVYLGLFIGCLMYIAWGPAKGRGS